MLKNFRNKLIAGFIFIFLIIMSSLLVKPVYNLLDRKINDITKLVSSILVEKADLKVTYKTLSPSILSSFTINDIEAYDSRNNKIFNIGKAKVSYNLNKIFTGSINQIVKSVTFDSVVLYGNNLETYGLYLVKLYSNPDEEKEPFNLEEMLVKVEQFLPQSIYLKNVSADYANDLFAASGVLKKINFVYVPKKAVFDLSAEGSGEVSLPQNNLTFTSDISLNSLLFPENKLEASSAELTFENLTDGNFYLAKTCLNLAAEEDKITFVSGQNAYPMSFNGDYNFSDKIISGSLQTDNFYPHQLLSVEKTEKKHLFSFTEKSKKTEQIENQAESIFAKIKNIGLSISAGGEYDLKTSRIAYSSSGSAAIPSELVPGGLTAVYSFFGNDKKISVPSVNVSGPNYFASGDLSFIFDGLQVAGTVEVPYYNLPNGTAVSAEFYVDTLDSGYMVFSPQVMVGDVALTAMQINASLLKDSVDFDFEVSDYSHAEEADPGIIKGDGSFLFGSQYLQASVSLNSFFADTAAKLVSSVLNEGIAEKVSGYIPMTKPYMLSADGYITSDLKSVSYNVPYVLLADTTKDNVALMLAVDGNEQTIQVNQLNLVYGKQTLSASASLDRIPDSSDMFVICDFSTGDIPYHLSGTIMPEQISFSGNYGADLQFNYGKQNFGGHVVFDNLPLQIQKASIAMSLDADFSYSEADGPEIQINRLVVEETGSLFSTNPILSMAGNATKYGAQFSSISFSDQYSTLEGYSDISVNITDKTFDSATIAFDISNPISKESVNSNITLSTPDGSLSNMASLLSSLYVDCQINFSNFSLNRFTSVKSDDNEVTMSAFMTGPVNHPYVTLNVDKLSMILGGILAKIQGTVFIEDRNVIVDNMVFDYSMLHVKDFSAELSLDDFKGSADAAFYADIMGRTANIPLHLEIQDSSVESGKFLPSSFTARLSSENMSGTMIKKPVDFTVDILYLNKNISFYSSENIGLYGSYGSSGDLFFNVNSENLVKLDASGTLKKDDISIKFSNLNVNLKDALSYFNFDDLFILKTGEAQGSVLFAEKPDGPEFKGALYVVNPTIQIPKFVPYDIKTDKIRVLLNGSEIRLAENVYTVKNKHHFKLSGGLFLNKWVMDHAEASLVTVDKEMIPVKYQHSYFSLDGEAGCDLNILMEDSDCNISGSVLCENLQLKSSLSEVTKRQEKPEETDEASEGYSRNIHIDVGLKLGSHANINFDPLLRCVFSPNTSVRFLAELENGYYDIVGNLGIKSGDISYLNRSFYIKEGNVKFNSDNLFNPSLTLKAETREKDAKGENVRIIISAENQLLLDFEPKFSSIPVKSENEIKMLLGQVVVGDMNKIDFSENGAGQNALQLAEFAGDYAIQSVVFRGVENKLRNLMNIDIFSVRTNILQNISNKQGEFSAKQLFDNSSLYVGRYFGDMFYFDAMVNLSYNDDFGFSSNKIDILPEFGIELDIPISNGLNGLNISSNLRWSMAPNLSELVNKNFKPNSSVTLSWKLSF